MVNGLRHWVVVPAAGSGRRMGAQVPKQYLALEGRPVIAHTLERLGDHPLVAGIVVVSPPDDEVRPTLRLQTTTPLHFVAGGSERCISVLKGVREVAARGAPSDWVLVHDAVRPCVRHGDVTRVIDAALVHPVGAILGVRVRDTVKRSDARSRVLETVDRDHLWLALTPQMFRVDALTRALEDCTSQGVMVTDEAQAMERMGATPCLVEGHRDNIKITSPPDLALAAFFLQRQAAGE